jgi:Zn-dependent protease
MFNLDLPTFLTRIITLVIAYTIHEFSHAWVAYKYGDDTAARAGRLTLNPLVHLDVIGSLMLLVGGFGWAKPVPVNPYTLQRKSTSANMFVSLAGPVSNMLLAILAAIPFRLSLVAYAPGSSAILPSASDFLLDFIVINISLVLFNLIPIAPLDGEKVLYSLVPSSGARFMDTIRPYGPIILLGLILLGNFGGVDILSAIMRPPLTALFRLLLGV